MNLARFTEIHLDPRWVVGHLTVDVGHRQLEAVRGERAMTSNLNCW
jgi:hypothetical protein